MKIICEKEKIIKALNSVTKAVASKPNNPILEGILIQTNNNELKLTTYDLEIGIEYIIDCEVEEEANVLNIVSRLRKAGDSAILFMDAKLGERESQTRIINKNK